MLFQRVQSQDATAKLNVQIQAMWYPLGMDVKLNLVPALENLLNYLRKGTMTYLRNR